MQGSGGEAEGKETDLAEHAGKQARGNIPDVPNTSYMVVIHRVPNGNYDPAPSMQLQVSCTDVRQLEEQIDFIEKN
jgi:hypothetical protein